MSTHCCNYCLKTIAMVLGMKQHITQSARCQLQWKEELRQARSDIDGIHCKPSRTPEDGLYGSDGGDDTPDLQEGSIVGRHCISTKADPHNQQGAATKHVSVSDDIDKEPNLSSGGHFTKLFEGVAVEIFGTQKTQFESLEEAVSIDCERMWAPFCEEEEWEFSSLFDEESRPEQD
ncbi:hypothetical protein BKA83DRAFT_4126240 [Pisolithus microcarpus]|nr:hypothetical protein BKA83DRAFT_4126240 [Pisolithus microcarpus]